MLYFLCFISGVILTVVCGLEWQRYQKSKKVTVNEQKTDTRYVNQWENVMNYSGSEFGQKEIDREY